jgi:uncharacterized protein YigE (DUF2233 family)
VVALVIVAMAGWAAALTLLGIALVACRYAREAEADRDWWCDHCHRAWREAIDLQAAYDRARRELAEALKAGKWWQEDRPWTPGLR